MSASAVTVRFSASVSRRGHGISFLSRFGSQPRPGRLLGADGAKADRRSGQRDRREDSAEGFAAGERKRGGHVGRGGHREGKRLHHHPRPGAGPVVLRRDECLKGDCSRALGTAPSRARMQPPRGSISRESPIAARPSWATVGTLASMKRFLSVLLLALFALSAEGAQHPQTLPLSVVQRYPFNMIGQLLFTSGPDYYVGSGTVVKPSSILTAGHNVFDPSTGWSTDVEFRRANYGTSSLTDVFASHLYLLAGYQSQVMRFGPDDVRSFAYDTAGAIYPSLLAGGKYALVTVNPVYLNQYFYRLCIGYGAEGAHTGDYPLYVLPTTAFYDTYGEFWENSSIYIEGGISGGPLLVAAGGTYYITGVIVSGSTDPETGGIRHIGVDSYNFIRYYLK